MCLAFIFWYIQPLRLFATLKNLRWSWFLVFYSVSWFHFLAKIYLNMFLFQMRNRILFFFFFFFIPINIFVVSIAVNALLTAKEQVTGFHVSNRHLFNAPVANHDDYKSFNRGIRKIFSQVERVPSSKCRQSVYISEYQWKINTEFNVLIMGQTWLEHSIDRFPYENSLCKALEKKNLLDTVYLIVFELKHCVIQN